MAYDLTPSLDELKSTIRKSGLRSTAPRIAVLRRLSVASTPISHGELVDALASDGMDRTTIYRNLVDLTEVGLVSRTDLGDHVWRFELRREGSHAADHPHFVCVECGGVSCLPGTSVRITAPKGAPRALERKAVKIQLSGLCDACA